jgi:hypothetical protein
MTLSSISLVPRSGAVNATSTGEGPTKFGWMDLGIENGGKVSERQKATKVEEEYKNQLAAMRSERDELRAALQATKRSSQDPARVSDYEWHVELAAKGLAERDNYPIPHSVTTPNAFYEVMAAAALDAAGLRSLLARVARAEQNLEIIQKALRQADLEAGNARHRATNDAAASWAASIVSVPNGPSADDEPKERPGTSVQAAEPTETTGVRAPSTPRRRLHRAIRRSPVRIALR